MTDQYIITEEQLKAWRKGCVNISNSHTDDDICKKCKYRGIKFRAKCCDFDDNAMEDIFRSHPYNPQAEREKLINDMRVYCKEKGTNWAYDKWSMEKLIEFIELRQKGE
jgi:hypothetical protein